jgi:hypothetical protein
MKRRAGAVALAMLVLGVTGTGCAVGTNDDEAGEGVEVDSGDGGDDPTTTTGEPDGGGTDDDGEGGEGTGGGEEPGGPEGSEGALLLIMDASGSMNEVGTNGEPLIDTAKEALRGMVETLPDGVHTGLRVFGHRYPNTDRENGCRDTELIAPVAPLDREALVAAIDGYQAKGFTPIGHSLEQAAGDLPPEGPRAIILVSDGDDTCAPPDPCAVAQGLVDDGVEVAIHTVGLTLGDNQTARDQLSCIAEATGGEYVEVEDADDLAPTLESAARESRRIETEGEAITGAAIPRDAETGELDTRYVDTIVHGETNFYRFEIDQGSHVEAEVYTAGNPDSGGELHCVGAYLVDRADDNYAYSELGGDGATEDQIDIVEPVVVDDADEVYLKIESDDCTNHADPNLQFDVELLVRQVD